MKSICITTRNDCTSVIGLFAKLRHICSITSLRPREESHILLQNFMFSVVAQMNRPANVSQLRKLPIAKFAFRIRVLIRGLKAPGFEQLVWRREAPKTRLGEDF
jgi:hypothetical protein